MKTIEIGLQISLSTFSAILQFIIHFFQTNIRFSVSKKGPTKHSSPLHFADAASRDVSSFHFRFVIHYICTNFSFFKNMLATIFSKK